MSELHSTKKTNIKHGHSRNFTHTRVYSAWHAMKQRCLNKNTIHYNSYGGRGISVCERWLVFENFLADVGEPPSPEYSLDRIDNNGNYEPGNIRWATKQEQMNNTRRNAVLVFNCRSQSVADWARELGLNPNTIIYRLRRGWSVERSLLTLNGRLNTILSLNGRSQSAADWARELGIALRTITTRVRRGWSHDEALLTPVQIKVKS